MANFALGANTINNTGATAVAGAAGITQVVMSSRAQQEIIDAQLAVLPYGDSPLLKSFNQKTRTLEGSGLQVQTNTSGASGYVLSF